MNNDYCKKYKSEKREKQRANEYDNIQWISEFEPHEKKAEDSYSILILTIQNTRRGAFVREIRIRHSSKEQGKTPIYQN